MQWKDRDAVIGMMRDFYASPAVLSNGSEAIFAADFRQCVEGSPYLEGYVFEEEETLQGYAMLAKSFSTEFGKPCVWIEDLYIKSAFRGQGLGGRFLQFARRVQLIQNIQAGLVRYGMTLINVVLLHFADIFIQIIVVETGMILVLLKDIVSVEPEIDFRCFREDRIVRRRQHLGVRGVMIVFGIVLRCREVVRVNLIQAAFISGQFLCRNVIINIMLKTVPQLSVFFGT